MDTALEFNYIESIHVQTHCFQWISAHGSIQSLGYYHMAVISEIEAKRDTLIDLRVERPSLEDRFLEITNFDKASEGDK